MCGASDECLSLGTAPAEGLLPCVDSMGRGAVLLVLTVTLPSTPSRCAVDGNKGGQR